MMGLNWGLGWGGMWFGWLFMIGLTVAFVYFIVWLVRLSTPGTGTGQASHGQRAEAALDILQVRYARGEITREEYLDMQAALRS